jgi:hypothetical protein
VKYADDLVLLVKEEAVVQVTEFRRCYGTEMNMI